MPRQVLPQLRQSWRSHRAEQHQRILYQLNPLPRKSHLIPRVFALCCALISRSLRRRANCFWSFLLDRATPTVSIAPAASGGDLHILLTADQAASFQSIMGLPGVCEAGGSSKKKRQSSGINCIYQDAIALMYNAYRGKHCWCATLNL